MSSKISVEILSTMLDQLGFESEITLQETEKGCCLQIASPDSQILIGQKGDRLDDIQYLVNRILQDKDPESEKVRVDCDHYRENSEKQLQEKVLELAEEVKRTGIEKRLQPLNAYHRRLVHNFLVEDSEVSTSSPQGSSRFKRITISPNT